MRIIGKSSIEAKRHTRKPLLTVCEKAIHITKSAMAEFDISHADKVKFIIDEDFCSFFKTSQDDPDGMKVWFYGKTGKIPNKAICETFREIFGRHKGLFSFPLIMTKSEINGHKIIRMDSRTLIHQPSKTPPTKKPKPNLPIDQDNETEPITLTEKENHGRI